ncbi:hypothetical protein [Streptomyces sp. NPDC051569]|uniref:hypothetical protein n=1 Tax=Streptomyces sp. NPDC051569 TaxID=3365661 RepID=UPI00378DB68D
MRFRTALAAALGAFALVVTVPGSASAAEGHFEYLYTGFDGETEVGLLVNPDSRECITLREVAGEYVPPADAPRNRTDASATVFTGAHCEGDYYTLRPGGSASRRLKLRSVVFS